MYKSTYLVFDTSALKTCCKKDPELEAERLQLKSLRSYLLESKVNIKLYYSTEVFGEYKQIPALIKKCNCELDPFGQAFHLALRRMEYFKKPFKLSSNISIERVPSTLLQKVQKGVGSVLDIDEDDKKFIKVCACLALKENEIYYITLDREILDKSSEIVRKLKSDCNIKGKIFINKPSDFFNKIKK